MRTWRSFKSSQACSNTSWMYGISWVVRCCMVFTRLSFLTCWKLSFACDDKLSQQASRGETLVYVKLLLYVIPPHLSPHSSLILIPHPSALCTISVFTSSPYLDARSHWSVYSRMALCQIYFSGSSLLVLPSSLLSFLCSWYFFLTVHFSSHSIPLLSVPFLCHCPSHHHTPQPQ